MDNHPAPCLVTRPAMRLRYIRNDDGFMCWRIRSITADPFKSNCIAMASNAVRSSLAIAMMRAMSVQSFKKNRPGCEQNQAARRAVANRLWGTTHQRPYAAMERRLATAVRSPQSATSVGVAWRAGQSG